jgi:Ca2+-binding EF-hand superfamily protein
MLDPVLKSKLTYLFHMLDVSENEQLHLEDFDIVAERVTKALGTSKKDKKKKEAIHRRSKNFFVKMQKTMELEKDTIDLEDWLQYFDYVVRNPDKQLLNEVVRYLLAFFFGVFDANRDGYFSAQEYEDLFATFGISKSQSQTAFNYMDLNKDGRLTRYELLMAVEIFLTSPDPKEPGQWIFGDWK